MERNPSSTLAMLTLLLALILAGCLPVDVPCHSDELAAPELLEPADGALVSGVRSTRVPIEAYEVQFAWSYPESPCIPGAYRIDISESADFADISPGFGTYDDRETSREWPLPEGCYYWRAAAYSSVDDRYGPFSPAQSFCVVPEDAFPTSASEFALLGGWAYTDENANGLRDAGEGGIAGALLTLKVGLCPGGDEVITVETGTSGRYWISPISPGDYCLATSPLQQTLYPSSHSFTLSAGEMLDDINFRYLLEPLPTDTPVPTSVPSAPLAILLKDANCREGPSKDYDVVDFLVQGQIVQIEGRNQDSTWWWVLSPNIQVHCWIWGELVEVSGDTSGLPLIQAPPLPTPTPVQGCWVWNQQQQRVCVAPCPPNAQPGGACTP